MWESYPVGWMSEVLLPPSRLQVYARPHITRAHRHGYIPFEPMWECPRVLAFEIWTLGRLGEEFDAIEIHPHNCKRSVGPKEIPPAAADPQRPPAGHGLGLAWPPPHDGQRVRRPEPHDPRERPERRPSERSDWQARRPHDGDEPRVDGHPDHGRDRDDRVPHEWDPGRPHHRDDFVQCAPRRPGRGDRQGVLLRALLGQRPGPPFR